MRRSARIASKDKVCMSQKYLEEQVWGKGPIKGPSKPDKGLRHGPITVYNHQVMGPANSGPSVIWWVTLTVGIVVSNIFVCYYLFGS